MNRRIKELVTNTKILQPIVKLRRDLYYKRSIVNFRRHSYAINERIYSLLFQRFNYSLSCGNLLGIVRERQFLKYELDFDYGIVCDDIEDIIDLYDILTTNGFKFHHYMTYGDKITEVSFLCKNINIDFFVINVEENSSKACIRSSYKSDDRKYKDHELSTLEIWFDYDESRRVEIINNTHMVIPGFYKSFLIANYGDDWETPKKNVFSATKCGSRIHLDDNISIVHDYFDIKKRKA